MVHGLTRSKWLHAIKGAYFINKNSNTNYGNSEDQDNNKNYYDNHSDISFTKSDTISRNCWLSIL